ncbi:hypothetical protein JCM11641_002141 [Rhodosporidiobolus odoratus]
MSTSLTPPPASSSSHTQLPMPGISLGIQRITLLLSLLQSPHLATPIVHIAGTNGKGSVSAYLSSILSTTNPPLRVGRFNSPHLVDEWDCIRLPSTRHALDPVSERLYKQTKQEIEQVFAREDVGATSFEILTATAFTLFARSQPPLDLAVVEVGMGGAEDATNVVPAEKTLLSVVTAIELDHQKFLGDTVGEIATVKAGIIKEGVDVVLAQQAHPEAVEAVGKMAKQRHAPLHHAGAATVLPPDYPSAPTCVTSPPSSSGYLDLPHPPLVSLSLHPVQHNPTPPSSFEYSPSFVPDLLARLPLPGDYQRSNAATAVLAASLMAESPRARQLCPSLATSSVPEAIQEGVEKTRWEGRLSWISLPATIPASSDPASFVSNSTLSSSPSHHRRLLLDGAHNPSSAALLASYLISLPTSLKPTTLIFALSSPRAPTDVLTPLLHRDTGLQKVICVGFSPVAGMDWVKPVDAGELAEGVQEVARRESREDVEVLQAQDAEGALRLMKESEGEGGPEGTALVAGSLYLVADVLRVQRWSSGVRGE